jgi:hypothetical protein
MLQDKGYYIYRVLKYFITARGVIFFIYKACWGVIIYFRMQIGIINNFIKQINRGYKTPYNIVPLINPYYKILDQGFFIRIKCTQMEAKHQSINWTKSKTINIYYNLMSYYA